ncbi:MAG: hypothetical protein WBA25_02765 [Jannaschia sp.]
MTITSPGLSRPRLGQDVPLLTGTAAALGVLSILLAFALLSDGRSLDAENVWLKPLKFSVALGLYCATLAFSACLLPSTVLRSRGMRRYLILVVACILAEQAWVTVAAASGLRSHYNQAQPLLTAIYPAMGLAAFVLTTAAGVFGWHILRAGWGEVERAVGWSFLATFALTVPIAFTLSGMPVTAPGLPPFGWTLLPGDLRPAHFLATHAMQAVPLAAIALATLRPLPYGTGAVLTAAWSALTLGAAAYGLGLL